MHALHYFHTVISAILSLVALASPKINCDMYSSVRVFIRADQMAMAKMMAVVSRYIDRRPYFTAGGIKRIQPTVVPT